MTEKAIEAEIIAALRTLGCAVTKTSQPRASKVTRGIPDVYCSNPAWRLRLWLEIKTPTGKVSAYQRAWHETERAAGGNVAVVRSVGDVLGVLRGLGAPIGITNVTREQAER